MEDIAAFSIPFNHATNDEQTRYKTALDIVKAFEQAIFDSAFGRYKIATVDIPTKKPIVERTRCTAFIRLQAETKHYEFVERFNNAVSIDGVQIALKISRTPRKFGFNNQKALTWVSKEPTNDESENWEAEIEQNAKKRAEVEKASSESYKQKLRDIIEKSKQATDHSKEKQQFEAIKEENEKVKSDLENNKEIIEEKN